MATSVGRTPPTGHGVHSSTRVLAVGALGVVFGDIGTNPLFAMREAFEGSHEIAVTEANILGLLSLMFWALILVISVKYLATVMRADNHGEGGVLALAALVTPKDPPVRGMRWILVLIGLLGAALLYGDGVITPAISVLAAVEGTAIAAPDLEGVVVPAAIAVLIALFVVQRHGSALLGRVFGPIMIVWFTTIGVLGAIRVIDRPAVFRAINPSYAVTYLSDNGFAGYLSLGAVILVVVGGEALYADMGHFGRRPILFGWYSLVLPSLVLVYFGQGALLLNEPAAVANPFYEMVPEWGLYPMVVLATMATVIASQALISGAFSLTRQAAQLGYLPRVNVRHTSALEKGQIYIGSVNWLLMIACIGLVLGFQESTNLAAAYGLAVTATMVVTTLIFFVVARERFGWSLARASMVCSVFLVIDLGFLGATMFKIPDGGWFPLVVAAVIFTILTTWRTGRRLVGERLHTARLGEFLASLALHPPARTPGASAFLFSSPGHTPPALLATVRQSDALHEDVLVISIITEEVPRVLPVARAEVTSLSHGFHQVVLHFGFMEDPDVPRALAERVVVKLGIDLDTLSYILGREALRVTPRPGMAMWRERLFAVMSRNATSAASYYHLPVDQTIEVGTTVEL